MPPTFVELVEGAARARNNPPIARHYLEQALQRIEAGQEQVCIYPGGKPSLRAVYEIAARLEASEAVKN